MIASVLLAGLLLAPTTPATTHQCGLTPRIDGVRYDVHEVRGSVSCSQVKRTATIFLRDGTVAEPWVCFRGHGNATYAAQCARGKRVLVRVYAPG